MYTQKDNIGDSKSIIDTGLISCVMGTYVPVLISSRFTIGHSWHTLHLILKLMHQQCIDDQAGVLLVNYVHGYPIYKLLLHVSSFCVIFVKLLIVDIFEARRTSQRKEQRMSYSINSWC